MQAITIHQIEIFLFFILIVCFPTILQAQSNNYWTRSFNEESSLLSGAVVGGGAGPSAIYYNPAGISEITESKFSFHASLFSFDFLNIENALGNGIDLKSTRGIIEPRFISYMLKSKKHPEWSFEVAFLNSENYKLELTKSVDQETNILTNIDGNERYFSLFQYTNIYRDDWIGAGWSWQMDQRLFIGASLFVSIKQLQYNYTLDTEVFPLDSVFEDNEYVPFYSANYQESDYLKYNDYRILGKLGVMYKMGKSSIGVSVTSPSLGGIYSDGKRVSKKQKQSNISNPETGEPLPDYVVVDYEEKKEVNVNNKSPFSVAVGLTLNFKDTTKVIYTTVEYFGGIDPYKLVQANENPSITSGNPGSETIYNEWLTFVSGAKPIFNAAIGYRWYLKKNMMMMAGYRTDFNSRKNYDDNNYFSNKTVKSLDIDIHHITTGFLWRIRGQDIITGLQYTVGREKNQEQYANLSDPVEFIGDGTPPLQGPAQNTMNTFSNSISFYFGATLNFGGGKNQ